MSVIRVYETSTGIGGDASGTAGSTAKVAYDVTYGVEVDDLLDEGKVVLDHFKTTPTLPWMGRRYRYANGTSSSEVCRSVRVRRLDKSYHFQVDVRYEPLDQGGEQAKANPQTGTTPAGKESEDPTEWSYEIEESSYSISKPVERAVYRNAINAAKVSFFLRPNNESAVVNSAWTAFDPPLEEEEHILLLRITWYALEHDSLLADRYHGSVNSDAYQINLPQYKFLRNFAPQTTLCKVSQQLTQINGVVLWRRSTELHRNNLTWRRPVLDRGFSELLKPGDRAADGSILSPSDFPAERQFENRALTDADGNRGVEPILLDGSGRPLPIGGKPVYLVYSTKPEIPFAGLVGRAW